MCDGDADCEGGEDEECKECPEGRPFQCNSGKCIRQVREVFIIGNIPNISNIYLVYNMDLIITFSPGSVMANLILYLELCL